MSNQTFCIDCGQVCDGDNPYWCMACDEIRKKLITENLHRLLKELDKKEVGDSDESNTND